MLLSVEDAQQMLGEWGKCDQCGPIKKCYCRNCDEFTMIGHLGTCSQISNHLAHQLQFQDDDHDMLLMGHVPTRSLVVEVDMPGAYLLVVGDKVVITSNGMTCTRFCTEREAQAAIEKYYDGRKPMRFPSIFRPDWFDREQSADPVSWRTR